MFGSIRSFVVGAVVCGALVAFSGTAAVAAPPWLGLEIEPTADHSGAKISEILPESPLAAAGVRGAVQRGDVVQSVAGVTGAHPKRASRARSHAAGGAASPAQSPVREGQSL
jgi:S1-C subfamily serine protease